MSNCCSTGPRCVPCPTIESQTRPPLAPGQLWYDPITCSFKYLSSCSGKLESLSAKPGNGLVYDEATDRWNIDLAAFSGLGFTDPDGKLKVLTGPGIKIIDGKVSLDPEVLTDLVTGIVEGLLPEPPDPTDPVKEISVKTLGTLSVIPGASPSADTRVLVSDTAPNGWNIGAGRMSFSADIRFNNYFSKNPGGHMAIVLRQDPALATTAVRGQGIAIGNLVGAPEGTQTNPGIQAEAWANGTAQANRLIPSTSAPTKLLDNTPYKLLVESSVGHDGRKYVRYALYRVVQTGVDVIYDTGDVLDTIAGVDMTKSALMIGEVFGAGATGWEIAITNAKVVWGPFGEKNTDFSGVTAVLAARSNAANSAFAASTAFKAFDIGTERTWTTIKNNNNTQNAEFGSWDGDGSTFTFTQAGSFQFDIYGVAGGLASNAGQLRSTGFGVYADFGTFQAWVGGLYALIPIGTGITFTTGVSGTIRIPNVTIGQTFKLVAWTDPNPGFSELFLGWGVQGGVKPTSGTTQGTAASGVTISRY